MTAFRLGALVLVAVFLTTGLALAQQKPKAAADCPQPSASVGGQARPPAPEKIEGTVNKIDAGTGAITVRASDGTMHEFRGNQDTLKDLKVGDQISMSLRQRPNC
jgi:hypothetical protein